MFREVLFVRAGQSTILASSSIEFNLRVNRFEHTGLTRDRKEKKLQTIKQIIRRYNSVRASLLTFLNSRTFRTFSLNTRYTMAPITFLQMVFSNQQPSQSRFQ